MILFLMLTGRAADLFGRRRFFIGGLLLFAQSCPRLVGSCRATGWRLGIAPRWAPVGIFRLRTLTGATLVSLLLTFITSPPLFFGTLYLQQVVGTSPFLTSLAFLPESLSIAACCVLGARLTTRLGTRWSMMIGMSVLILSMVLLAQLSVRDGYWHALLPGLVVLGFGLGIASIAATSAGMAQVKAAEQGLVAGLLNTAAQLGTALGLALLDIIAASPTAILKSMGYTDATALVAGFRWAFFVSAGVAVVGVLVAAFVIDHYPNSGSQQT